MTTTTSVEPCAELNTSAAAADTQQKLIQRAQWLRAAILGANDGLLSTTSLMLGVGAAKEDHQLIIISGVAGAVAGACSMAVGEFVSVSTQRDVQQTPPQINVETFMKVVVARDDDEVLPNPYKAAGASAVSFLCGSLFPLVSALLFSQHRIRILAIVVVASVALLGFGWTAARLGGSPVWVSAVRVLLGGWISMAVTYALLKPLDRNHESK